MIPSKAPEGAGAPWVPWPPWALWPPWAPRANARKKCIASIYLSLFYLSQFSDGSFGGSMQFDHGAAAQIGLELAGKRRSCCAGSLPSGINNEDKSQLKKRTYFYFVLF